MSVGHPNDREFLILLKLVVQLNENVRMLNRATFGDSPPEEGANVDQQLAGLARFGHSLGERSREIASIADELKKAVESRTKANG